MSANGAGLLEKAKLLLPEMVRWRREIHMHPELGFKEHRTAEFIASVLAEMGVEYMMGVGGTGVVAKIGQGPGVVGIRADMDALPIQEENNVPYASQYTGVMHACGHDAHVAMALGALRLLMDEGSVGEFHVLFQPSEETCDENNTHGSVAMINDGALEGLDAVIALHVHNTIPFGKVAILPGYAMAGGNYFEATIFGKGGHDSLVHQTVDPIFIASQVVNAFHAIRSRRIDPIKLGAISIGSIHAGTVGNIIPERVDLSGTIRVFDDETRHTLHREIERVFGIAKALGGDYALDIKPSFPSVYNNPDVCEAFRQAAIDLLGEDGLYQSPPFMGVEDFAYMTRQVPGAMVMIGSHSSDAYAPLHNPRFDVDETIFAIGAALLASTASRLIQDAACSNR